MNSPQRAEEQLTKRHLAELREGSGLTDETIVRAGIYSTYEPQIIRGYLNWRSGGGELGCCLAIPYPDLSGNINGFARLKPDNPRRGEGGKTVKYEQPIGIPPRAYFDTGGGRGGQDARSTARRHRRRKEGPRLRPGRLPLRRPWRRVELAEEADGQSE